MFFPSSLLCTPAPITPSSKNLHRRRSANAMCSVLFASRQESNSTEPLAPLQQDLLTFGGSVYMTNVTLGGQQYTLVIDTGSSDTWIASSSFQCQTRIGHNSLPQDNCGFGVLYDEKDSLTYSTISTDAFSVRYTDGEFLQGEIGTEELGVGGENENELKVRQTIGVAERGWWMGDDTSSGVIGLAYSTLASKSRDLNYTSVIFSLFENGSIPSIFSLALSRPTIHDPVAGGLLAFGGIPDIKHDDDFVSVPIHPFASGAYEYYSIPVDGFDITAPSTTNSSSSRKRQRQAQPSPSSANASSGLNMLIDSGSTLMYLPDATADYIASLFSPHAAFSSSTNTYIVPCSASPPNVGVIIGGKSFFINPDDLMNKAPNALGGGGLIAEDGEATGMCTIAVQRQGSGNAVLGDSWLKGVLAVFDLGANEMRFSGRLEY